MTYIRGSNPVWTIFDLTGHIFDDTYYMFVLQNTLPYLPAPVYHSPSGTEWTDPIRFFANGTLPIDIFWDSTMVYRLEFRRGNTQADPLIYLVENYSPGGSGNTPVDEEVDTTSNQITNPQFALIDFNSPLTLTSIATQSIQVAPGWFLDLVGSGNVTLAQVLLNSTTQTVSNPSYALNIQLNGTWTSAILRQRFQQNGVLWANKIVSCTVTASTLASPQSLLGQLYDSQNNLLATVLETVPIDGSYVEYPDNGTLGPSSNTDFPPDAYIEFRLQLIQTANQTVNVNVTSLQLIVGDFPVDFTFEQDTIERQIDHTFHVYKNSILIQPKNSVLTGWDFGLNPWQFSPTAQTNLATFGYTADQTIVIQQAYVASTTSNNVSVGRVTFAINYALQVQAVTATNQFAVIQYLDPATIRDLWSSNVSSLVEVTARKQNGGASLRLKMRLIYRASLPPTLGQNEPISAWAANGEPVFAGGWTAITPLNDPSYNLANGFNAITFEKMQLPVSTNDNMMFGIVLYTVDSMTQTGTPDYIAFNNVSLIPNDFALESNYLTQSQVLNDCQYYYETSYGLGDIAGTAVTVNNQMTRAQAAFAGATSVMQSVGFDVHFNILKRSIPSTLSFYSPTSATANLIQCVVRNTTGVGVANQPSTSWTTTGLGVKGVSMIPANNADLATTAGVTNPRGWINFHYSADSRLGV